MANRELVQAIRKEGTSALVSYRESRPRDMIDLFGAILPKSDLKSAPLFGADLRDAHLAGVDLRRADLRCANLSGANMIGANVAGAVMLRTQASTIDFNSIEGVEKIRFDGPCDFGISSILSTVDDKRRSVLLKGCGIDPALIENLQSVDVTTANNPAVFLAFIRKDGGIARWMAQQLKAAGIPCWNYIIDQDRFGKTFADILTEVRLNEHVVFLASEASLASSEVEIHLEKVVQARKLMPVSLDDHLSNDWFHYLRNDIMQLPIVSFTGIEETEAREAKMADLIEILRR